MTKIISFVNQKGGVGKTTSVINIAAAFAQKGCSVLVIDMDPQGNTSQVFTTISDLDISMFQFLTHDHQTDMFDFDALCQKTYIENLDVFPSNVLLSSAEIDLINEHGRETVLKRSLKAIFEKNSSYDYILIDCPPSLGILTVNAIVASDYLLVPLQADIFSLTGLELLIDTVSKLQSVFELKTILLGFFFTQVHEKEALFKEAFELCATTYQEQLFKTFIRSNTAINHAHATDQSVLHFAPSSHASQDYLALAEEINMAVPMFDTVSC